MASTYSNNLKLELITTGEKATTWGSITNTNLGTTLEEAIVGSADVTFSSSDLSITLTNSNATQAARHVRLNLTGTTGGTARTLTVPDIEKTYIINNGCADAVAISNSTGSTVSVPAGKTMWVYSTGSNVVDVTTHLTSLTVGATPSAVVTEAATQTLTNKTLTAPTINDGALGANTTATTQSASDNSTKVATTEYVDTATGSLGTIATQDADSVNITGGTIAGAALAAAYPVGSIYMNASSSTNPATLLGFGTWTAFGEGRMLVGLKSSDTDFDTAEETGGSKTHTLTVDELPAHSHDYAVAEYDGPYDYGTNLVINNVSETTSGRNRNANTEPVGGGSAHSIMNPYIVVYMWKRTA